MAGTRVQLEVEDWVRTYWMSSQYGQKFHHEQRRWREELVHSVTLARRQRSDAF